MAGLIMSGSLLAQKAADDAIPRAPSEKPPAGAVGQPPAAERVEARELVRKLADEAYQVREAAHKALWDLGEEAVAALEEGMASEDPERAHRSRLLLRRIVTGIGPDTPKEIANLVESYFKGGIETKRTVLERLQDEGAYSQVLRLYRFEKDAEVRAECEEIVDQVVFPAVSVALANEDLEEAEALLRLAPPTDDNLRRRAALSRALGNLDEELAAVPEGTDDPLRLALLRSKGNVPEALALAEKLGRGDVVASLSLFQGDPVPFFEWFSRNPELKPLYRLHAELARDRWVGDERGAARLAGIMREQAAEAGGEERIAMLSLLLNGYLPDVMKIWEADGEYLDYVFSYYDTVELPRKALELRGYTGDAAAKKAWRKQKLRDLEDGWQTADQTLNALIEVAAFLTARGETAEGHGIIKALAAEVLKQGGDEELFELLDLLGSKGGTAYELAFVAAAMAIGDQAGEAEITAIFEALFRDEGVARRHWARLEKNEEIPDSERLLLLAGIYGFVHIDPQRIDAYRVEVRKELIEANGPAKRELLSDLLEPAATRDDVAALFDLLVELAELDGFDKWSNSLGLYAGFVDDWKLALKAWQDRLAQSPNSYRTLAKLAAAHMRNGQPDQARPYYEKVDRLALDEPEVLQTLMEAVYTMGEDERAEDYLRRLLLTASPESSYWLAAAGEFPKHLKRSGNWAVGAAFAEVNALQEITDGLSLAFPVYYLRKRFESDLLRGLAIHEAGDRETAVAYFDRCFALLNGDGLLADDFFPLLRQVGLTEEHDRYFEQTYRRVKDSIEAFPDAHNTYNSAAWLASRACRKLDEAEQMATKALSFRPRQAAYLDTMGEVWFAKRNREKAIAWGEKACHESYNAGHTRSGGAELRGQLRRFRDGEFPVK